MTTLTDPERRLRTLWWKLRGRPTCAPSKSGHSFTNMIGEIQDHGWCKAAVFSCDVCGLVADYNSFEGVFRTTGDYVKNEKATAPGSGRR